ncbi:Protein kinase [Marasmius crinis-equi]|uniref:non-specific serine/threonine protein kinase n=1 Tax=Marasmius crinis-equi TaxID=585013 RepID=A0ABR3FH56_9AGAR
MGTTTDSAPIFPASKLGEYKVIKDIAEGTFGIVRMAVHTITGHHVAMKYISKAAISREKTKTRVRREFEYMRALRHPHIIKLYEVIFTPTDIIFVLEYAGGELFNYIVANGRMPEPRARRFFQQIISGIEYSHRLKIVHRDLKPENVLLDDDLNVKIADFGLSSEISDGDFLTTSCGSPNYAAPEVIRGGVYAGPEIDVWSSGVILYVMLCGRLPFEDDDVQVLFSKISRGEYHTPSYLSSDARSLIQAMLAVDPVKRITIPDIIQHPFFVTDLPAYLSPLPPKPGPVLGTLATLVSPPVHPMDFEIIEGLGRIEEDVVDELSARMDGVTKEDIWEALRREDGVNGNAVKVAYMLLRDKRRLGKDLSVFAEQEREAELAARDPRNALSPGALSPGGVNDLEVNPFEREFITGETEELLDQDDGDIDEDLDLDAEANAQQNFNADGFAVLNSSLPEGHTHEGAPNGHSHHSGSTSSSRRERGSGSSSSRRHRHPSHASPSHASPSSADPTVARTKWHFGIRSRSPPMEIMLEIYKTLKVLGMEWKEKKNLGGLGGVKTRLVPDESSDGDGFNGLRKMKLERVKRLDGSGDVDLRAASQIYLVETRARVENVVVYMNLQLYMVDATNYLVDFHHRKTCRVSREPGAGKFDVIPPSTSTLTSNHHAAASSTSSSAPESPVVGTTGDEGPPSILENGASVLPNGPGASKDKSKEAGVKEDDVVVSPYVFMDVACRLILELAGGGE